MIPAEPALVTLPTYERHTLKVSVGSFVVHPNDFSITDLDIERNGLATDLTVFDELLVPGSETNGDRGVLQAVGTAEDDLFFHLSRAVGWPCQIGERSEVPQFFRVDHGADRLDPPTGDVERHDIDETATGIENHGPGLAVDLDGLEAGSQKLALSQLG